MSLRTRLAILTGATVACAVVIAAIISYSVVRNQLYQQIDESLRTRVSELTSLQIGGSSGGTAQAANQIEIVTGSGTHQSACDLTATGPVSCPDKAGPLPPSGGVSCTATNGHKQCTYSGPPLPAAGAVVALGVPDTTLGAAGGYTQFVSSHGTKVLSPGENGPLPVTTADLAVAKGRAQTTLRTQSVKGTIVRIATAQMAPGIAVMVARPLDETDSVLANLRELLFFIAVAGIALAAGLGIVVARTTLRPVRRLIAATEHVAGTRDLTHRIEVDGGSELNTLAASFNRMLEALDRSEETQRQLVADASHELRTPLTSLRTNIEVLSQDRRMPAAERRRLLGSVEGQIGRLSGLVTGLIELARGNDPINAETRVPLADVLEMVVATARSHWPKLTFMVTADDTAVRGDGMRLERAIGNLVDNAAKWSPADGRIEITLERGEVRVRDHGPGVAPADREHVFDRFWRAPSARQMPGSGLGLAIVRQVAQTHSGDVHVHDAVGGGAVFILRIPPVSSAADDPQPIVKPATQKLLPDS
jgi:two-component system sensor histidine kinase MprB